MSLEYKRFRHRNDLGLKTGIAWPPILTRTLPTSDHQAALNPGQLAQQTRLGFCARNSVV